MECMHPTKNDDVVQPGGHPPANRWSKAYSLGLQLSHLILDIHVIVKTPVKIRYLLTSNL